MDMKVLVGDAGRDRDWYDECEREKVDEPESDGRRSRMSGDAGVMPSAWWSGVALELWLATTRDEVTRSRVDPSSDVCELDHDADRDDDGRLGTGAWTRCTAGFWEGATKCAGTTFGRAGRGRRATVRWE